MIILQLIFFIAIFFILYVYLGYPCLIFMLSKFTKNKVYKADYKPNVTILIAAFNEEANIESTLINKLSLDYPKEKIEIFVISDDSSDRTNEIVKQYETKGVNLLIQVPRAGKTSALNLAVPEANGEILVFSDANSIYSPDALKKLVSNFSDQRVGYVTGKMIYTNPEGSPIGDGCSAYMKYENFLRSHETNQGSIVGVDGGIDAIRKNLYTTMNPDQLPDFVLPLKVIEQGYRVVYESESILREQSLNATEDEYKMRVRVSLRALWALWDMRQLLSFRHFKRFAWQLWSHKVLRYSCFIFLLIIFFTNSLLISENIFYKTFFILQCISYFFAIISYLFDLNGHQIKLLYPLYYFLLLNLASAHAALKFMLGKKQVLWTPRK